MLLDKKQQEVIKRRFEACKEKAKERSNALFAIMEKCDEEELFCMQYLYAFMPQQDLANYTGELFLQFVRQALKIRNQVSWGRQIPDVLFLSSVLQYRINNEDIIFYKDVFAEELLPRIKDMSMMEAVIEINYWCFEKATYQSTDNRTASPFTVIKNTYGRCGEESTLAVAALRSVGIPARQVYAPRWAHCDDNHAWVEVWVEGVWHFLGACEPEPVCNVGWFTGPASKAMLIDSKVFLEEPYLEEVITQEGGWAQINCLDRYAETKTIEIVVENEEGQVMQGAEVHFQVVNYSELFTLAKGKTDTRGAVKFKTGLGDLFVWVVHEEGRHLEKIDTRIKRNYIITLKKNNTQTQKKTVIFHPSKGSLKQEYSMDEHQKASHEEKLNKALGLRNNYKQSFYNIDQSDDYAKKFMPFEKEVSDILQKALGNAKEIVMFLEDETTSEYLREKILLLQMLRKKDVTDITCSILNDHLVNSLPYKNDFSEDIFTSYILAPRIKNEMLSAYKGGLKQRLEEISKETFINDPQGIYHYIEQAIATTEEDAYPGIYANPVGLWDLKKGSQACKNLLVVALYRTLGIPARLDPVYGKVSYYKNNVWYTLTENGEIMKKGKLILSKQTSDVNFKYFKNFTIAKLEKGVYQTLGLQQLAWEETCRAYHLEAGKYRIITSNRQADEVLSINLYELEVKENQSTTCTIDLVHDQTNKQAIQLEDHEIEVNEVNEITHLKLSNTLKKGKNILAYIEVGKEPTEHLLNELLENSLLLNNKQINCILIVKNSKAINDKKLQKVLETITSSQVYIGHHQSAFNKKQQPVVCIANDKIVAEYIWSGYHVGIGQLLVKYAVGK